MVTSIHPDFDARIFKMASSIARNGFEIDLVCPWDVQRGDAEGINYRPFPKAFGRSQRYKNYYRIWKIITEKQYDIYHFHDLDLLPLFIFIKLLSGKHVVYDMHENYPEEMLFKPYLPVYLKRITAVAVYILEWVGIRILKNFVVVEEGQAKRYQRASNMSVLIRNFATKHLGEGRKDDYLNRNKIVIFTGSQYESNGSLVMVEIARIVCETRPEVLFYCMNRFGNDEIFREKMVQTIKQYGLENNVLFLPNIRPQDIMEYLNQARIAMVPTLDIPRHRHAIPNKIFEYMAAGLPIVASDLPNNRKFIESNGCGFIVSSAVAQEFANKVKHLLANVDEARKMGEKGIEVFNDEFNWEKEILKLQDFYIRLG